MSRAQNNICNINRYAQRPILECKEDKTCEGWSENDSNNGESEEIEWEEEEAEFKLGNDVECGEIAHFGDKCVDMDDSAAMNAVLTSMCNRKICRTSNGYLRDYASDMCLTVSDVTVSDAQES